MFTDQPSSNTSLNFTSQCFYSPTDFLEEKFFLIFIFGTSVCLIGIFNNALLVHLLTRGSLIGSHVFYLAVLAGCDIVVEIAYFLLMSVQILYDYAQSLTLYYAWNNYLRPVFAISHVSMTISTYCIVAASAERYLASTTWMKRNCAPRDRLTAVVFIVCFAVLSKGMVYWELEVVHLSNCTGFEYYTVRPSALAAQKGPYKIVYMLWFRHMAHVFVPFVLLIILNVGILVRLQKTPVEAQSALLELTMGEATRRRKKSVRAATRMLIAMVTTYLISNVLSVVITVWEHLDMASLHRQEKFYAFSADTVSLLTVITSAIRLPIYCACNKQLRQDLKYLLNRKLCRTDVKDKSDEVEV